MLKILKEGVSDEFIVCEDEDTGIRYIFSGDKLVPINAPLEPEIPVDRLDNFDLDELERQNAERDEQIRQERIEDGEDPDDDYEEGIDDGDILDITDLLDDNEDVLDDLRKENKQVIEREAKVTAMAAQRQRFKAKPRNDLDFLQDTLNQLISYEVSLDRGPTYSRINRRTEDTGIITPGMGAREAQSVPSIMAFLDCSGSFSDEDVRLCQSTMATVKSLYEDRGLLKIKTYYFAESLHDTLEGARAEGGTSAWPEIMDVIKKQRPTNILVMTDDDMNGQARYCGTADIPGGALYLYKARCVPGVFHNYVKGNLLTKVFMLGR